MAPRINNLRAGKLFACVVGRCNQCNRRWAAGHRGPSLGKSLESLVEGQAFPGQGCRVSFSRPTFRVWDSLRRAALPGLGWDPGSRGKKAVSKKAFSNALLTMFDFSVPVRTSEGRVNV